MEVDGEEESMDCTANELKDSHIFEEEGFNIKGNIGSTTETNKQKKRRKKRGFTSSYSRHKNLSKALINLPSSLSDYTWIENTELNK